MTHWDEDRWRACCNTMRLAVSLRNIAAARQALDAFVSEMNPHKITLDCPVAALTGIGDRSLGVELVNALEAMGATTIRGVLKLSRAQLSRALRASRTRQGAAKEVIAICVDVLAGVLFSSSPAIASKSARMPRLAPIQPETLERIKRLASHKHAQILLRKIVRADRVDLLDAIEFQGMAIARAAIVAGVREDYNKKRRTC